MENGLQQDARFIREVYRKAAVTGMLSILSVNISVFVDGILVGQRVGADALAAINLSMPLFWVLSMVGGFFAAGTEIPAARAIGVGDARRRDAFFSTGLNASVLVSLALTALALAFRGPLVSFLCAEEAIRPYVSQYVTASLIGALPRIVIYIPFWFLRLDGKNRDVCVMMIGLATVNIALDVGFVYFLDMGLLGAGLAGTIASALACAYGLARLFAKGSAYSWRAELIRGRKDWRTICAGGFPSFFNSLCSAIRLLIVNAMLLAHGGGHLVAVCSAVNGILGFGECITLGVPSAGGAMLGVFSGERDNGSCRLLLKEEMRVGSAVGGVFLAICLTLSGAITSAYGLSESLLIPLTWMALSVFPALFLNILAVYYNMMGMNAWANLLILLRQILMTWICLRLVIAAGFSVFSFLLFAELSTATLWWGATGVCHLRHPRDSRYLLTDLENEKRGRVLNFSVSSDLREIVSASERVSAFCDANGMNAKETLRLQLSMEEVMTLIRQVNGQEGVQGLHFDLRVFSIEGVQGVRIRYSGIAFNPFGFSPASGSVENDMFLGARMIGKMVGAINYQRAFGVNTLQILLKGNE